MKIMGKITKKKLLISMAFFLLIVLGVAAGGYWYIRNKIYANTEINTSVETTDVNYKEVDGITNILLLGVDARDLDESSRSDSMMIATIDSNNKKIKITSIMRDSYVDIPGYKTQKINAAYSLGGADLLMDTIEENFNIKLDKYVVINFWGFEDVIDLLGGIDVEVKDYEISEINKYIGEVRDVKSPKLTTAGMQHLDGQQALAYARIRKVGNGGYERDSRQREVIQILAQKVKDINALQYATIMNKILPSIKTNIEPVSFLNYAFTVSKFDPLTVQGMQIPMTELSSGQMYNDTWVLLMDKKQNSKVLYDFIFNDKVTASSELDMVAFKASINVYLGNDSSTKTVAAKEPTEVKETAVDKTTATKTAAQKAAEEAAKKAAEEAAAEKAAEAAAKKAAEEAAVKKAAEEAAAKKAAEEAAAKKAAEAAAKKAAEEAKNKNTNTNNTP